MGWPYAKTALKRWQGAAWPDVKDGQHDIRMLLIVSAVALVRWAALKGAPEGSWLARMLELKPKMLVAVALANRMARTAWALMRKGEDYRDPAMATA